MMKIIIRSLVFAALTSASAMASDPDFAHLMTTGFGEVKAKPDIASFSVRVVETTSTAEEAKALVDKSVAAFLSAIKEKGVSKNDIQSSNLYLAPQYQYPKDSPPKLVGYQASRHVDVQVDNLSKLNSLLDVALRAGVDQVENIRLKVSNEREYQARARAEAIADAKDKAAVLAEGFDRELGEIWQIEYDTPNRSPVLMRSAVMDATQVNSSYQDATIVIRDQVDVIYKID